MLDYTEIETFLKNLNTQSYCGTNVNALLVATKKVPGFSHMFGNSQLAVFWMFCCRILGTSFSHRNFFLVLHRYWVVAYVI